jgi:hypothetical protein
MFVFFVFDKNCLIKSCSSFEDLSVYKMSWSHVEWCKFCIHLRSSNVRHFGMVKCTGLKVRRRGHLQWHELTTEFHKNLPIGSKVIRGDTQTDRQAGDLISLTFLFEDSRLKKKVLWHRKSFDMCLAEVFEHTEPFFSNSFKHWLLAPMSVFRIVTQSGHPQGWIWRQYVPLKRWYRPASPHGFTTQKTNIDIFTAMRTSSHIGYWVVSRNFKMLCEVSGSNPRFLMNQSLSVV